MTVEQLDIRAIFDLSVNPAVIRLASIGSFTSPDTAITIFFKITDPAGNEVYDNLDGSVLPAGDIDLDQNTETVNIALQALLDGKPINGCYKVVARIVDTAEPVDDQKNFEFDLSYAAVTQDLSRVVTCATSSIVSTDATAYDVNGVSPTITRSHGLQKPSDMTSTVVADPIDNPEVTQTPIDTGTWKQFVTADLQYDFTGNVRVIDQLYRDEQFDVDCQTDLCKIYNCMKAYKEAYDEDLGKDPIKDKQLIVNMQALGANWVLLRQAQECGNDDDVNTYYNNIEKIVSGSECGCKDEEESRQVVPLNQQSMVFTTLQQDYGINTFADLGITINYTDIQGTPPFCLYGS